MKKNKFYYLLIVLVLLISSCEKQMDYDLRQSVYVEDVEYKGLPQYSEWGYNTFGAYYDREVFVSNDLEVPVKLFVTNGKSSFIFHGQKGNYGDQDMIVTFSFDNFLPTEYPDLLVLNDSVFDLTTPNVSIDIQVNGVNKPCEIIDGYIYFKRVQDLFVDGEHRQVILSGLFEFQVLMDNYPIAISDGRFDVGIGYSNFFVY